MSVVLASGGRELALDRPRIMGVLNVTPDSFSDGGQWLDPAAAVAHARAMIADGADIVDVGGESTRPGAEPVDDAAELERVVPVIEQLAADGEAVISVDTSKPAVMQAAVAAGATMVNDVFALRAEGALAAVAGEAVAVCLMHMQGEPRTMQDEPVYDDVVREVSGFLLERAMACEMAGIDRRRIVLDPGFGFGKSLDHNRALFQALPRLAALGFPLLVGVSRKSMLGSITGRPADQRLVASAAAAMLAAHHGAAIVRVHDVAATRDALRVLSALA